MVSEEQALQIHDRLLTFLHDYVGASEAAGMSGVPVETAAAALSLGAAYGWYLTRDRDGHGNHSTGERATEYLPVPRLRWKSVGP